MARKASTKKTENADRVAVLSTHVGENLLIRSNPDEDTVREFVKEHNRRYHAGETGGPSGIPAYLIIGASYYDNELDVEDLNTSGTEIDISGL